MLFNPTVVDCRARLDDRLVSFGDVLDRDECGVENETGAT